MQTDSIDFKKLIETGDDYAQVAFMYNGTAETGMLAWIDADEMKHWWRADNVIIEPYLGGMFYITWSESDESSQHVIYGVMKKIDAEAHCIEVSKIMYLSPVGKLGPLHLEIRFEPAGSGQTRFWLRHTHGHKGQLQKLYNAAVQVAWPKTFALLKEYLEARPAA